MSAVSAIINMNMRFIFYISIATTFFCLAASPGQAATEKNPLKENSAVSQVNKMLQKDKPAAGSPRFNRMMRRNSPASGGPNKGNGVAQVDVKGVIYKDSVGEKLLMPNYVFCDHVTNETYVLTGGYIEVYDGDNKFPVASLGRGRGITGAGAFYVDTAGNVYVTQNGKGDTPTRITIFNAAFFPIKEINLEKVDEIKNTIPRSLIVGDSGQIYLTFQSHRGLLVLDKNGEFSHWIRPIDTIFDRAAMINKRQAKEQEEESADITEEDQQSGFDVSELLPELFPKKSDQVFAADFEPGIGPVKVTDVERDSNGYLYLLSSETSKVYVYTHEEEYLFSFGEKGGSTGKLAQPSQLAIDEKKKAIYVVDPPRHTILIYDLSGRFMYEFGGMGNRPGWFQYPTSLALDNNGQVIVADKFNGRVQYLAVNFEYKFPLFQVPFTYYENNLYEPLPIRSSEARSYYGPGFMPGDQASVDNSSDTAPLDKSREDAVEEFIKKDKGLI